MSETLKFVSHSLRDLRRVEYVSGMLAIAAFLLGFAALHYPAEVSVLILVVALAIAIFVWPIIGVHLIVITIPLMGVGILYDNPERINIEVFPITFIPFLFTAVILLLKKTVDTKGKIKEYNGNIELFLIVTIVLFAVASLLWTPDTVHGINNILYILMCFWMVRNLPLIIDKPEKLRSVMMSIILISLVLVSMTILSEDYHDHVYNVRLSSDISFEIFMFSAVESANRMRLGGFAPVNVASNILNLVIFVIIYFMFEGDWKRRIMLSFLLLVVMYCNFKTVSKSGIASLIMGLGILVLLVPVFRERLIRICLVGTAFLSLLLIAFGEPVYRRFETISQRGDFFQDRLGWWEIGFGKVYDTYGMGLGVGGFPTIVSPVPSAHSAYFSVLFEFGFIGCLLAAGFVVILLNTVFTLFRKVKHENMRFAFWCMLTYLIITCVHSLVDLEYCYLPPWLAIGFMMTVVRMKTPESSEINIQHT